LRESIIAFNQGIEASTKHPSFDVEVNLPFRLDLTTWALRRRSNNIVDRLVNQSWRRVLVLKGKPIELIVNQKPIQHRCVLHVKLAGLRSDDIYEKDVAAILEKCLGINEDLNEFYKLSQKDENLCFLANHFLGLKPPMFPTVFEAVVNGIACQQVSLDLGIILLNRLSTSYGFSLKSEDEVSYAFPSPENLSNLSPDNFRNLGFSCQKGRAIIELAQAITSCKFELEKLDKFDNAEALERLCQLRGVGRWTGEYVLLRGLGRLDVFPADDVGGRRGLQQWLNLNKSLDYSETKNIIAKWSPYAGLVYFHLLMNRLTREGCLKE
jgi:DNA-3-methyladenine glycosylase II